MSIAVFFCCASPFLSIGKIYISLWFVSIVLYRNIVRFLFIIRSTSSGDFALHIGLFSCRSVYMRDVFHFLTLRMEDCAACVSHPFFAGTLNSYMRRQKFTPLVDSVSRIS